MRPKGTEIRWPRGEYRAFADVTPAEGAATVRAFDCDGSRLRSRCLPTPALPPGAWAAELASVAPADGGLIAAGWTVAAPTEREVEVGLSRPRTSPVVYRAVAP